MSRRLSIVLTLLALVAYRSDVLAQNPGDAIERSLGLPPSRESGVEIRVLLDGNLRVNPFYRLIKTETGVLAERYAISKVYNASDFGQDARGARRETDRNRRLLREERCIGKIVETPDHMWCRLPTRTNGDWAVTFEDLLPYELWNLPPQGQPTCGPNLVVLDGEVVKIDLIEPGRRRRIEYPESRYLL